MRWDASRGSPLRASRDLLGFPHGFPQVVRADTATLQSVDYNAACVEKTVKEVSTPWGWVGYSQGCANAFRAESMMLQAGCPCETAGGSWSMVGLGFMAFVKYKVYSTQLHTRTHSTLRYVMLGYVPFRSVTLHTSI